MTLVSGGQHGDSTVVTFPEASWPSCGLITDSRQHYVHRRRYLQQWTQLARGAAGALRLGAVGGRCVVRVYYRLPGLRRDFERLSPTTDAILAGLREAGVVPDAIEGPWPARVVPDGDPLVSVVITAARGVR